MLSPGQIALRLAVALLLGFVVGAERESREQAAGFRTHALVSVGAALFGLISVIGFQPYAPETMPADPSRVAAQVVAGVGFLGAGAILRLGASVRGLTTAASLWVVAAIGLAAGIGMYYAAVAATVATVFALLVLRLLREPFRRKVAAGRAIFVIEVEQTMSVGRVLDMLAENQTRISHVDVNEEGPERIRTVSAVVQARGDEVLEQIVSRLSDADGIRSVEYDR